MTVATGRRIVVVDGSNLATEGRTLPSLRQLDEAVRAYSEEDPDAEIVVVVDATFEHRIDPTERQELVDAELHGELVSPPAGAIGRGDAFVLRIAERTGATVLSNDSFQEFHGQHPWLFDAGRLVGGKPVPGIGWIFTPRIPVRGPKSRQATSKSKRDADALTAPAKAAELSKAAKKAAAARRPPVLPDGSVPKVGDVWPPRPAAPAREAAATEQGAPTKAPAKRRTSKKVAAQVAEAPETATEEATAPATSPAAKKAAKKATAKALAPVLAAEEGGAVAIEPGAKAKKAAAKKATKKAAATKAPAKKTPAKKAAAQVAEAPETATEEEAAAPAKKPAAKKATKKASKALAADEEAAVAIEPGAKAKKATAKKATKKAPAKKAPAKKTTATVETTSTKAAAAQASAGRRAASRDPLVQEAIGRALAEAYTPEAEAAATPAEAAEEADGAHGRKGKRRRRRASAPVAPPPAANEPLAFITFVASYPLHSLVEGEVVSFTSHGAMVDVDLPGGGTLHCYIPLSGMGDPPPTKARQVLSRGERRPFELVALDPPRRVAELALAPERVPEPESPAPRRRARAH